MFETDVLSQLQSLSALTGLDPSEFSHVVIGGAVSDQLGGAGDFLLGTFTVQPRFALVITSVLLGSGGVNGDSTSDAVRIEGTFFPFFNLYNAPPESFAFLRLDGSPLIQESAVQPFAFAVSCLHVIGPGVLTFGVALTAATATRLHVVGRLCGFLCPVEAAEKLRANRTNFFSAPL